jgi:MraZ protein
VFLSRYHHTIDAKGRLSIPGKYREALARRATDVLIVTTDEEQCLAILPLDEWERRAAKIQIMPDTARVSKDYRRSFHGDAVDCTLDGQGRILIPPELRQYAGLERDVMLVGLHNYFEAWSLNRWQAKSAQLARDREQIVGAVTGYGV